jgi:hypothetical protein
MHYLLQYRFDLAEAICHIKAVENKPSMPIMARMIVDSVIIATITKGVDLKIIS